jgi:hypothetical protein
MGGWNDDTLNDFSDDWVQVEFDRARTINEINVYTLQDDYANSKEPTEAMEFTSGDHRF